MASSFCGLLGFRDFFTGAFDFDLGGVCLEDFGFSVSLLGSKTATSAS